MFARFLYTSMLASLLLLKFATPSVAQPFRPPATASPSPSVRPVEPSVVEKEEVYFGLTADTVRRGRGAEVLAVDPGGPADRAGMRTGDVIERCNGLSTPTVQLLGRAIESLKVGQAIPVEVRRDGVLIELKVTPSSRPPIDTQPQPGNVAPLLGVVALPVDAVRLRLPIRSGAVIDDIMPGTPADLARLPRGGVIVGLNDTTINSPDELRKVVASKNPGDLIRLHFYEGIRLRAVDLRLAARAIDTPLESRLRPRVAPNRAARQQELRLLREELQRIERRIEELEAELR